MKHAAWIALVACAIVSSAAAEELPPEQMARVRAAETARIDVIAGVQPCVLAVFGASTSAGGGSGVIIDPAGFALTNFHVVQGAGRKGKAGLAGGRLVDWDLVGIDPGGDLAIIRLKGDAKFPAVPLGDSRRARAGQWALVMGNPFLLADDFSPTVTLGIISGVERFQAGATDRMLVYGNCIQVDASINPGNSGGPLFDAQGRLLGINGRGSFEERGRVNVGVGYAISVEQAKYFLADLLSGKLAQHGTLDATFRDEDGHVICEQLNENAPIARAGLKLGDRLLRVEGQPIRSANQFLNLQSTLPGDWPTRVTYQEAIGEKLLGGEKTAVVRLRALGYGSALKSPPGEPEPRRKPRPQGKTPDKPAELPGKKPATKPAQPDALGKLPEPGGIIDPAMNRQVALWLLARAREERVATSAPAASNPAGLLCVENVLAAGQVIGRQRVLRAADGRFRCEVLQAYPGHEQGLVVTFDGSQLTRRLPDGKVQSTARRDVPAGGDQFLFRILAALQREQADDVLASIELDGGDKARGQRAFRVKLVDRDGRRWTAWYRVLDAQDRIRPVLLKLSDDVADENAAGWTFSDERPAHAGVLPYRRSLVRGLEEREERSCEITECQPLDRLPDDAFASPAAGAQEPKP